MATNVYGSTYYDTLGDVRRARCKDWFTYTISETNVQYSVTLTAGIHFYGLRHAPVSTKTVYIAGTGQTTKSGTTSGFTIDAQESVDKTAISSFTWIWVKGHSSASKTITAYQSGHSDTKASKVFTVPAKPSYTVTYNANGGTGQPANQTKWYGESLTLTTSKPTKTGYTFKGWATSTANAGNGTVNYASGATYTDNAALNLYAVWELTYSKPSIVGVSVERCDANGNSDDDGQYARVNFDWSVFISNDARYYGGDSDTPPYADNTISSASVTVGTYTKTFTASDTLPIIVGGGLSTDTQYDVSITITDSQSIVADHTTTVTGTLSMSYFPMDFNANATAMGIFMPAPDTTEGIFIGKDLFLPLNTSATTGTDKDIYDALVDLGWTDVIA